MWYKIKDFAVNFLIIAGIIAFIVGIIGNVVYQLTEFGVYVDFVLYNHWSTWMAFGGGFSILLGYLLYQVY